VIRIRLLRTSKTVTALSKQFLFRPTQYFLYLHLLDAKVMCHILFDLTPTGTRKSMYKSDPNKNRKKGNPCLPNESNPSNYKIQIGFKF
jgi:hypothetical protein